MLQHFAYFVITFSYVTCVQVHYVREHQNPEDEERPQHEQTVYQIDFGIFHSEPGENAAKRHERRAEFHGVDETEDAVSQITT